LDCGSPLPLLPKLHGASLNLQAAWHKQPSTANCKDVGNDKG
jgi:hypothetical protein